MLYDEPATLFEQVGSFDPVGNGRNKLPIEGWIGENDIEPVLGFFQEGKSVGSNDPGCGNFQSRHGVPDKPDASRIHVYASQVSATAGCEFVSDVPRSAKDIQHGDGFQVEIVVKDVEQRCLRKISGGTHRQSGRGMQLAAFEFSAYDSHSTWLKSE